MNSKEHRVGFTHEILEREEHRVKVRGVLLVDGERTTAEFELDARDGSPLQLRLAQQGSLGAARLANVRAQLLDRARDKAKRLAFEQLSGAKFDSEEAAEDAARRPMQAMSAKLKARHDKREALRKRVLDGHAEEPDE